MNTDFTKIDKSAFECIKFEGEGEVYFGLTKYLNQETGDLVDSIDGIEEEEEKEKYKKVRHGVGIQLYPKTEDGIQCKYAGQWVKDIKTGDAHAVYPDGSEYRGNLVKGVFNGKGMYIWPASKSGGDGDKRHKYVGDWLDGKMHGKGEFKNAIDGTVLKGFFAKNLYLCSKNAKKYFLNPLDTSA